MNEAGIHDKIDVSQIKEEEVAEGSFPASYPRADFRVWFAPEAHAQIIAHSVTNTTIELCGVLVGEVRKDGSGPFALVEEIIRGEHAENHGAQVTFTHATWAYIFSELDEKHRGKRIVGWYHTHPGSGIFLSPMDMFIQENFFNLPWQAAFVADPLSGDEGLFVWHEGKAAPAEKYWIGDEARFAGERRAPVQEKLVVAEAEVQPAAPAVREAEPKRRSAAWDIAIVALLSAVLVVEAAIFYAGNWDSFLNKDPKLVKFGE